MTDALKIATEASNQTDRWCFFAALVVLGIICVYVAKYLVKQSEKLMAQNESQREAHQTFMKDCIGQLHDISTSSTAVIDRNNIVMQACTDEIKMCREERSHRR